MKKEKVAILGASNNPSRYAHMAFLLLKEYGHEPVPVSPKVKDIEGEKVFARLGDIPGAVDTLTMYVGPELSAKLEPEIIALPVKRVIFNPGSENPSLAAKLEKKGVRTLNACTLVLLRKNEF